jgi:chemotaxis protein histidine kinase CheA
MSDGQIIHAPHNLKKAKIGTGPAKLDPKAIERAERAVKSMEKDYAIWAQDDLAALEDAFARFRAKSDDPAASLRTMFRIALDMKGQGASFGYQMITRIADLLAAFLETHEALGPFDCEVVAAHLAAMRAVFAQEVRGDGGMVGTALVDSLNKLIDKAAAQAANGASS